MQYDCDQNEISFYLQREKVEWMASEFSLTLLISFALLNAEYVLNWLSFIVLIFLLQIKQREDSMLLLNIMHVIRKFCIKNNSLLQMMICSS